MKYFLFILILFSLNCIGQKKDSINIGRDITRTIIHTINSYSTSATQKQDTVRVLMLVCDTGLYKGFMQPIWENDSVIHYEQTYYRASEKTWWQFGYEVCEMQYGQIPCNSNTGTSAIAMVCYSWYRSKFIGYLDQNKKPLPSSTLVWMTKEIK